MLKTDNKVNFAGIFNPFLMPARMVFLCKSSIRTIMACLAMVSWHAGFSQATGPSYPYQDPDLPVMERIHDLLPRMTLAEKISQLGSNAPAVERLGIPACFYWNEALHGVVAPGMTSFPQAIALSATWDPALLERVATAISDEARVQHRLTGKALVYWSPVINMARDPRWGRTEETYGEDPVLTAVLATGFIRGMQGSHPHYLKTVATVKHFTANNVDKDRRYISSEVDERSLREYYLPAFYETVRKAGVRSVMSAYNALNGVPCTANRTLLHYILREEWGFGGFIVSDCDAVDDIHVTHRYAGTPEEGNALAIATGTDLNCGNSYQTYLEKAAGMGLVSGAEIDTAVARVMEARFRLGEFDPPKMVPYHAIPDSAIDCRAHRDLALLAARKSIVLLKNTGHTLPLYVDSIRSIAVIGPNADKVQLGGYSGAPVVWIPPLNGIAGKVHGTGVAVSFAPGCSMYGSDSDEAAIAQAASLASQADVAIVVIGIDLLHATEERDRDSLGLPGAQELLVSEVVRANPKTVVVLVSGFPLAVGRIDSLAPALLMTWYNGQAQGAALADVLFGDENPGGKLTTTWYRAEEDLPPMDHYNIREGRTYQYFRGDPLYPFGYGLSYTEFEYDSVQTDKPLLAPGDSVGVRLKVTNSGTMKGEEVVQFYVRHHGSPVERPLKELKGFSRIALNPGESRLVRFFLHHEDLARYDEVSRAMVADDDTVSIMLGSSSADIRLTTAIRVTGGTIRETYRRDGREKIAAWTFENKSKEAALAAGQVYTRDVLIRHDHDWLAYRNIDFGEQVTQCDLVVDPDHLQPNEALIEIRLDSLGGPLAGVAWLNAAQNSDSLRTVTCPLTGCSGIRDLYLVFRGNEGGQIRLSSLSFRNSVCPGDVTPEDIMLYPNPADGYFYLSCQCNAADELTLEVTSLQGALKWAERRQASCSGLNVFTFNTTDLGLAQGMYLLRCQAGNISKVMKLFVL